MKIILHNDILHLHKLGRSWKINIKEDPEDIMSKLLEISMNKYPEVQQLLIPAFDYEPFTTKRINRDKFYTSFAFASIILSSKAKSRIDIIYDPVFSYIVYPGVGGISGNRRNVFRPFNEPKAILADKDIIAFTKNGFEPSHLMEIENILFGRNHPYRYNKIFEFTRIIV